MWVRRVCPCITKTKKRCVAVGVVGESLMLASRQPQGDLQARASPFDNVKLTAQQTPFVVTCLRKLHADGTEFQPAALCTNTVGQLSQRPQINQSPAWADWANASQNLQ